MIEARDERKLLRFQKQIASYELLIVDELGFVPLSKTGAELLSEVLSQRYERGSTLITSNLPFQEWTEVLGSERLTGALLDRLTHHVHGASPERRSARRRDRIEWSLRPSGQHHDQAFGGSSQRIESGPAKNEAVDKTEGKAEKKPEDETFWLVRYSKALIGLVIALVGLGIYLAFRIPTGVFPTTNFPRIIISLDNGVMPIDQMLVSVTRPVEIAVSSVQGLKDVQSITSRGTAEIDLFFDWNADMFQTLQRVDSALATVQGSLPSTVKVNSHRLTFSSFPILGFGITSDSMPPAQLWEIATYQLKPRLNRVAGVATVTVQGGEVPEYQITPDPVSLIRTSTTVPQLMAAIQSTNVIASPGLISAHHDLVLDLVDGQVHDPAELAHIVIKKTPAGVSVHVGDVATVHASVKPVYTVVSAHGKAAVLLNITRQPGTSTIAVAAAVQKKLEQLRTTLPPGIDVSTFYDQSGSVKSSLNSVRDAVLIGIVLASLVLILFLL